MDAAVLDYRNAVGKDPMFAPARLKLAEAYMRQGNGAGALAESVRAADLLPNDAEAQVKAGSLLGLRRQDGGREGPCRQGARDQSKER